MSIGIVAAYEPHNRPAPDEMKKPRKIFDAANLLRVRKQLFRYRQNALLDLTEFSPIGIFHAAELRNTIS